MVRRIIPLLMVLGLVAGCGKQEPAAQAPAATTTDEVTAPEVAPTPVDEAAEAPTPATAEQAGEQAQQLSETDDDGEVVEETAASTQPSLRLGGPAPAPASRRFQEGVHYKKLVPAKATSVSPGKVEVVEVFWYGCGHCYALDPAVDTWKNKNKPEFVELIRVPAMWGDVHRMHARIFYTAELLGKLDALHMDIFREIQNKGNMLNTADKAKAFFVSRGVSEADFNKTFQSFAVENKLKRADFLNRSYRVDSVPMFVINGKYTTGVADAGGEQQLFSLLNEVSQAENGG